MALSERIKWRPWLLRVAGSALILGVVLSFVPMEELLEGLKRVSPLTFLLVLAVFIAGHAAAAAKWWILMGAPFRFILALRAHFAGLAANLCLPTVAGGDAVRAALAYRACPEAGRIAAAATADRLIDLGALAAIAVLGALAAGTNPQTASLALLIILALGAVVLYLAPALITRLWTAKPGLPMKSTATSLSEALTDLRKRPLKLTAIWAASFAIQSLFILLALQLARDVGLEIALAPWAFAWALAKIIAILPVSINGLGLREASLASILAPFGAPAALVIAAGLAWQLVLFATGALGAVVLLLAPSAPPAPKPDPTRVTS